MFGEKCEIDALAIPVRTQGIGLARPYDEFSLDYVSPVMGLS